MAAEKKQAPRGGKLFVKGQSGNPGGRKPIPPEVREFAKGYTLEALQLYAKVLQDEEATYEQRLRAADSILDRGHGKPTQHIEANLSVFDRMSDDEQRSLAAALAAITGNPDGDASGTPATHH